MRKCTTEEQLIMSHLRVERVGKSDKESTIEEQPSHLRLEKSGCSDKESTTDGEEELSHPRPKRDDGNKEETSEQLSYPRQKGKATTSPSVAAERFAAFSHP